MTTLAKKSVKGGNVYRDPNTGKFVAVMTAKGTSKSTATSYSTVKDVSSKRRDALKRLADR